MIDLLDKLQLDKKKIIIILAISLVVLFLDIAFIISLQAKSLKGASLKAAKLKKDLSALDKDLALMKQPQGKPKISKKVKKIISESDVPYLIQFIDETARKNKVSISQIKPERSAQDTKAGIGNFKPVFILLEGTCVYHNLGRFIAELENAPDFVSVCELRITPDPGNYLQQKVRLLLKTYVKK
jgi:Tfp pilus assembly protein PilO